MYKKLGIIGGMGPAATVYFYEAVLAHTKAEKDQEHIDMVILNHASMPDRTQVILNGNKTPLLEEMKKCISIMEFADVANIVIPCNTSHYFYDEIQAMTKIPLIHMPRECIHEVKEQFGENGGLRVGILCTDGTKKGGIYSRECERFGCEAVYPSKPRQRDVMSLIYDDIKGGRTPDPEKFRRIYDEMKDMGCGCVVLACTELPLLAKYFPLPADCVDAMHAAVKQAVIRSGAPYIE